MCKGNKHFVLDIDGTLFHCKNQEVTIIDRARMLMSPSLTYISFNDNFSEGPWFEGRQLLFTDKGRAFIGVFRHGVYHLLKRLTTLGTVLLISHGTSRYVNIICQFLYRIVAPKNRIQWISVHKSLKKTLPLRASFSFFVVDDKPDCWSTKEVTHAVPSFHSDKADDVLYKIMSQHADVFGTLKTVEPTLVPLRRCSNLLCRYIVPALDGATCSNCCR